MSPLVFGLYKFAKYFAYPYTWLALCLGLLTLLTLLPITPPRLRWIRLCTVMACTIVFFLGNPFVATQLAGHIEQRAAVIDLNEGRHFDSIVVLGGGVMGKGTLRQRVEPSSLSLRRTFCGVELFSQGLAPRLLLVGGDGSIFKEGPIESVTMQRLAIQLGVPEGAIVVEGRSRNTYENAVNTKRLLGSASVLVVTSALHLPRALALFKNQGIEATGYPCGYYSRNRPSDDWDIHPFAVMPTVDALATNTRSFNELIGIAIYWVIGKI